MEINVADGYPFGTAIVLGTLSLLFTFFFLLNAHRRPSTQLPPVPGKLIALFLSLFSLIWYGFLVLHITFYVFVCSCSWGFTVAWELTAVKREEVIQNVYSLGWGLRPYLLHQTRIFSLDCSQFRTSCQGGLIFFFLIISFSNLFSLVS